MSFNPPRYMSEYKVRILETLYDLRKAIEEGDKQHADVLFDRLEKRVINRLVD